MTNDERAERAHRALDYWLRGDAPEMEANIRDLMSDLLHLCEQHGLNPFTESRVALEAYLCEQDDPTGDGWLTEYEVTIMHRLTRDNRAA